MLLNTIPSSIKTPPQTYHQLQNEMQNRKQTVSICLIFMIHAMRGTTFTYSHVFTVNQMPSKSNMNACATLWIEFNTGKLVKFFNVTFTCSHEPNIFTSQTYCVRYILWILHLCKILRELHISRCTMRCCIRFCQEKGIHWRICITE